jgi:hypothetical protein
VELARPESGDRVSWAGNELAALVLGGGVLDAGFLASAAGVIAALPAAGLPWWLAAFLVGLVLAGVGHVLVG